MQMNVRLPANMEERRIFLPYFMLGVKTLRKFMG